MKIIADNTVPYLKGIAESFAEVVYLSSGEFTPERIKDADVLIVRSIDKCTRELLEGSSIKLITSATIGFDHIDTRFCEQNGIAWTNSPGCNAVSVAQYVLACLIRVALRQDESLEGKTIGIVGVGHVGTEVQRLCEAYGMKVLRNDPPRAQVEKDDTFVDLDTIAACCDIITMHTPLNREGEWATYHLANAAFFEKMKKHPWFVNASRGAVHDTGALKEARRTGIVSQLILDCWENEPSIDRQLLDMTAIATPHIAGFSADGKANGTRMCLQSLSRFFDQKIATIGKVVPPPPLQPVIDLDRWAIRRVESAVLHCFDPRPVDEALRQAPQQFEWFRSHYNHPREFSAYTVIHATTEEAVLLRKLGFQIQ